ncbi:MAG TPA: hypothetical protein VL992_06295 [Tepidisphaeraceae bacterium]|nr:hypothetical protein [Tepidisphaeraceae bacterium]
MTSHLRRHGMLTRLSTIAGVAVILWLSGCATQSTSPPAASNLELARPVKIGLAAGDSLGEQLYSASQNPAQDTGVASNN